MSATTAGRDAKRSEGKLKAYPIAASTTIYKDTLVGLNSGGYLVNMSDTGSLNFVGVAFEGMSNAAGSNGDKKARVWGEGEFEFAYLGGDASEAKVGLLCYAQDNQTVDEDAANTTNDYPVGIITEFVSTTKVRVYVSKHLRVAGTVATGDVADSAITTAKINDAGVTAAKLTATMQKGFISLPLTGMRVVASNDVPTKNAADGGVISKDTDPILERVNGATDKRLRLKWAANSVIEVILGSFAYPDDLDDAAAVTVNVLVKSGGATDVPVLAISYFEGTGDTNAGGNTAAITATESQKTVVIAASDVGPYPKTATVGIVPGAHTTDTVELYGAWISYQKK